MGYRLPDVELIQDYANPGSIPVDASRPQFVIGALNQVVTDKTFPYETVTYGVAGKCDIVDANLGLKIGATLTEVSGGFTNATVEAVSVSLSVNSANRFVLGMYRIDVRGDLTGLMLGRIKEGSKIVHGNESYTVKKVDGTVIVFTRSITTASIASDTYKVILSSGFVATTVTHDAITEKVSISCSATDGGTVLSGTPTVSYTAKRYDLAGVQKLYRPSELLGMMDIDLENPLGFGVNLAFQANGGTVPVFALPLNPALDEVSAFAEALTVLRARKDAYYVSVCTDNPSVHTMVGQHVEAMRDPEIGYWRTGYIPAHLALETTVGVGTYAVI